MSHQITNDDILMYVCGELEMDRYEVVKRAIISDPQYLDQAYRLMETITLLRQAMLEENCSQPKSGDQVREFPGIEEIHRSGQPDSDESELTPPSASKANSVSNDVFSERVIRWALDEISDAERQLVEFQIENNSEMALQAKRLLKVLKFLDIGIPNKTSDFTIQLRNQLIEEDILSPEYTLNSPFAGQIRCASDSDNEDDPDASEIASKNEQGDDFSIFWQENFTVQSDFQAKLRHQFESEIISGTNVRKSRPFTRVQAHFVRRLKSTGIAAAIISVLVFLSLLFTKTEHTYALNDIPGQVQQLKSLYIKGRAYWGTLGIYDDDPSETPVEYYYERPNRYWETLEFSTEKAYRASDGKQYVVYDERMLYYKTGKDNPFRAKMLVEQYFQSSIIERLAGNLSDDYTKLREESLNGNKVDVYQQIRTVQGVGQFRLELWFDPTTGYPVKSHWHLKRGSRPERLYYAFDLIQPNAPPRKEMFDYTPPKEFKVVTKDIKPNDVYWTKSSRESRAATVRFTYNILDRAILVCWAYTDDDQDSNIDFTVHGDKGEITLRHHRLSEEQFEDQLWRWSLLVADDPDIKIKPNSYRFIFPSNNKPISISAFPLRYERRQLVQALLELQEFARPNAVKEGKAFSLEQLEDLIAKKAE